MARTFGAEDILSAMGVTAADWEVQESGNDDVNDTAVVKDKDGKIVAASDKAFNLREEKTITLQPKTDTGVAASFTLGGAGTGGVVITQFNARAVNNDYGTLQVTAHKHDGAGAHQATPVAQAVSVTLGFGVLARFLGGTLADCQSSDLSGAVEHVDKLNNQGVFLVGASTGLRFECTEEYVDDGADITVPDPWKQDSQAKATDNGDFYTRTVKAHAYSLS
jgi:hypothetical protein